MRVTLRLAVADIITFNPKTAILGFQERLWRLEMKAKLEEAGINLAYSIHWYQDPRTEEIVYWQNGEI